MSKKDEWLKSGKNSVNDLAVYPFLVNFRSLICETSLF